MLKCDVADANLDKGEERRSNLFYVHVKELRDKK